MLQIILVNKTKNISFLRFFHKKGGQLTNWHEICKLMGE